MQKCGYNTAGGAGGFLAMLQEASLKPARVVLATISFPTETPFPLQAVKIRLREIFKRRRIKLRNATFGPLTSHHLYLSFPYCQGFSARFTPCYIAPEADVHLKNI
jgi:hypothetical protein